MLSPLRLFLAPEAAASTEEPSYQQSLHPCLRDLRAMLSPLSLFLAPEAAASTEDHSYQQSPPP